MPNTLTPCKGNPLFTTDRLTLAVVAKLKELCNTCPVQQECLDLAIENEEEAGVWGGLTYTERGKYAFERTLI